MPFKETALLRFISLKIPSLLFVGPRVREISDDGCAIEIPLGWRTRNHVGSMYVGVLCAGADLASGMNAARAIYAHHPKVVLVFADLKAEFLKRADGDVVFRTTQGREIAEAVRRADETGERQTIPVHVVATVPKKYGDEPVARFTLSLSLKRKDAAKASAVATARSA